MNGPRYFRVYVRSAPGMWTTYDGYVKVELQPPFPEDGELRQALFRRAVQLLAATSFRDRPSLDSWRLEAIEEQVTDGGPRLLFGAVPEAG